MSPVKRLPLSPVHTTPIHPRFKTQLREGLTPPQEIRILVYLCSTIESDFFLAARRPPDHRRIERVRFGRAGAEDSFATGNDATRETVIRGVIEPGAGYREDFFMIHRFNTFFFDLVAEGAHRQRGHSRDRRVSTSATREE